MALNEDSRPFTALRQGAEDFRSAFDEDIKTCLALLDSKISTLLCNPDSLTTSMGGTRSLNAHVEFSKSKLDIFVSMKSHVDEMESDWVEQICEMKKTFLENVEIFLAGTKLEVKLPPSEPSPMRGNKRRGKQSSSFSSPATSLYPALINTANNIAAFNSLLPEILRKKDNEEVKQDTIHTPSKLNGKPKRVTIASPPTIKEFTATSSIVESIENDLASEYVETQAAVQTPVKRSTRGSKKSINTPVSLTKMPAKSSLRKVNDDKATNGNRGDEKTVGTPQKRGNIIDNKDSDSSTSSEENVVSLPKLQTRGRRGVKLQSSNDTAKNASVSTPNSTPGRKTRTPSKRKNVPEPVETPVVVPENEMESDESEIEKEMPLSDRHASSKFVDFSIASDVTEDLEIYTPVVNLTRAVPRRKTAMPKMPQLFVDVDPTPEVIQTKSKRKTIASAVPHFEVAPSPKRFKKGGNRNSIATSALAMESDETMEWNPLESDGASEIGQYSPWIPLSDISGQVPPAPGIYELKVAAAKKPAYIGGCDSLRQKLTLHKLVHGSGHKQLDKFIERNAANILCRYEPLSSGSEAKSEEAKRVKNFVAHFKNTPAYN